MREQYGLQLQVEVKDDLRHLQDHMRVTLFQAVRELLFNVVKHSGTLEAVVMMERLDGHGRITIIDKGGGFDAKTVLSDAQATHGVMILRDRLNLMGGTVDIASVPGDGAPRRPHPHHPPQLLSGVPVTHPLGPVGYPPGETEGGYGP